MDSANLNKKSGKSYVQRFVNIHAERQVDIVSDATLKQELVAEGQVDLLEAYVEMVIV